jgi:hypothetical protein
VNCRSDSKAQGVQDNGPLPIQTAPEITLLVPLDASASCNLVKGDRVSGLDSESGKVISLFNPRTQVWTERFAWNKDERTVRGLSSTGRATIAILDKNSELRQTARAMWFALGLLPP